MKKVDSLKNSVVNVLADNPGEKKKILDGCKFCMEKRGCKCDKAEELFDQPSILSPYSPDNWVKASEFISEKPLNFPLKCYEYGPAFLRYCEDCQIVYKKRWYFKDDGMLEDLYCGTLGDVCPHCGKLGIPISDIYQDNYGTYPNYRDYYDDCDEYDYDYYYFRSLSTEELQERLKEIALEEELSMCYDELGGYFSEDEDMSYRDDEEEYWHFICYEELYLPNWFYEFDEYDLESYYYNLTYNNITMSTREIMEAMDYVESIFCGVEHPTNEEEFEKDIEFFRNYEFECKKTSTSWLNCNYRDKCLYRLFLGRRTETVLKEIEKRVSYIKENLQDKKSHLRDFYLELLEITLILHYASYDRLGDVVELVRKICMRREKNEADICFEIVLGLLDTVKALSKFYNN